MLIHKIHGGRKQDSKFWNSDYDLSENTDEEPSIFIPQNQTSKFSLRKTFRISFYPPLTLLVVLIAFIIAKPALFPFLDYQNIYSTINMLFHEDKIPTAVERTETIEKPTEYLFSPQQVEKAKLSRHNNGSSNYFLFPFL